jgi:hypothetical protein
MIDITIPLKVVSVANLRECWRKRASRAKAHRFQTWAELRRIDPGRKLFAGVTVTLTRVAPRPLDDDNLRSALKSARDGIADWFGVPDNHPAISWQYAQTKGKPKQYGLQIEIKEKPSDT